MERYRYGLNFLNHLCDEELFNAFGVVNFIFLNHLCDEERFAHKS